jgi:hypothetical protein
MYLTDKAEQLATQFLTRPHPLTDGKLLQGDRSCTAKFDGEQPVTVCIAARAKMIPTASSAVGQPDDVIVAAADRMLTSGDVQFEPSAGTKIFSLTNSIFMMTAGDAALQAEITGMVSREIVGRIAQEPGTY